MDLKILSKTVSHALRHEPWIYELDLDEDGWVSIGQLLFSLRTTDEDWGELTESHLVQMIEESSKQRHEICNGRIRALYGHSIPARLKRIPAFPPDVLFHGTSSASMPLIKVEGLKPMGRHHVHLSTDTATAIEVGKRKSNRPILLRVNARKAHEGGVAFYEGNEKVWLADTVPLTYIEY